MDSIDCAIISELKQNGRASASEISKKVHLSVPAVAGRIRKMEQTGIICEYTVRINREKTGNKLLVFIFVNIDHTANIESFRKSITAFDCVLECHHVVGEYDYLLKVSVEDTKDLEDFLSEKLKKIKGVASSNTVVTLASIKEKINV
jgi:Lrp/AsnC family leucine-responsive transcriptional regulator